MERSKILVVDDEKLVRRMIARVLESEGMSIVEASNGLDAVQMAKAQPFDLIILDIIMEGIDGFQVIHQLRSEGMLTPVFILSGRQADNDKVFALGIGADDYITKPFSPSVLCSQGQSLPASNESFRSQQQRRASLPDRSAISVTRCGY